MEKYTYYIYKKIIIVILKESLPFRKSPIYKND